MPHSSPITLRSSPQWWDVWGAQPQPGEQLNGAQAAFFDNLAEMARQPDKSFDELRKLYENDDRVRVPATVFNALLNRPETVRNLA